jgi:hypothetical protein
VRDVRGKWGSEGGCEVGVRGSGVGESGGGQCRGECRGTVEGNGEMELWEFLAEAKKQGNNPMLATMRTSILLFAVEPAKHRRVHSGKHCWILSLLLHRTSSFC